MFRFVIAFWIAVVPFVVRIVDVRYDFGALGHVFFDWTNSRDVAVWYKSWLITWSCAVVLVFAGRRILSVLTNFERWCFGAYFLGFLGSSFFAPYPSLALMGAPKMHMHLGVWLSLPVLYATTKLVAKTERGRALVIMSWKTSLLFASAFTWIEYFWKNPFSVWPLRAFVFGEHSANPKAQLLWTNRESIASTFDNPNFLGFFFAISVPFLLSEAVFRQYKKSLATWLLAYLSVVALFLSHSKSGVVAAVVGGVLVFLFAQRLSWRQIVRLLLLVFCVGVTELAIVQYGRRAEYYSAISAAVQEPPAPQAASSVIDFSIVGALLTVNGEIQLACFDNSEAEILDIKGRRAFRLSPRVSQNVNGIPFRLLGGKPFNVVLIGDSPRPLTVHCTQSGPRIFAWGQFHETDVSQSLLSETFDSWFSNRGYIWSRALFPLADRILLGFGPDSFIATFPRKDFARKFVLWGRPQTIVERPHNAFLQVWYGGGLIAALGLAAILFRGLLGSLRERKVSSERLGFFAAALLLLAFNDLSVTVISVFVPVIAFYANSFSKDARCDETVSPHNSLKDSR